MITVLNAFCAVAATVGLGYMLRALYQDRGDVALRYLCVVFGLSVVGFTLLIPAVWVGVDALFDAPNIAALLAGNCVTGLVFGQQIVLQYWIHPPAEARRRARRRVVLCALVLLAMALLFAQLDPSVQRPRDFSVYYGPSSYYFTYLLLYVFVYTSGEVLIARTAWRNAKETDDVYLRRGLRFLSVGSWLTLGYSAVRIINLFGPRLGFDLSHRDDVSVVFGNAGALLAMLGFTFPGWGPRLSLVTRWCVNLLNYHRLYHLWAMMHRTVPEIALFPPRNRIRDLVKLTELEYRLYRRVIEIRDGQLFLLPYADSTAVDDAARSARRAGLGRDRIKAVTAAVAIRTAVERRSLGRPGDEGLVLHPSVHAAGPDLDCEVAELLHIAGELRRADLATTHGGGTPEQDPAEVPGRRADAA
ncbi:MAB_1171c family putative transporter [Streptomyces kanasensis]|uniref:MAB_1171c family putative transporter n=1 Tax=Streptomyces kanasensis TaxID=936756 RepID=UPI0036FE9401